MFAALGVSVAVHVLGAVALWRGASEPERVEPGRPLEVRLVWVSTEAPSPAPVSVAHPAPPTPRRRKAPGSPPTPVAAPSEPVSEAPTREAPTPEAPAPEPLPAGGLPGAVDAWAPGTGGLSDKGSTETEAVGSPGGGDSGAGSELVAYREQLSRSVTRGLRYPPQAVRLRLEGTARVLVRINRDGSLAGPPRLEGSSRFRVLDLEALRVVEAAAPFSPLPPELSREAVEFVIPVSFSLRAAG